MADEKIKELLAVLDMAEEEQRTVIGGYLYPPPYLHTAEIKGSIHEHPGFDNYACAKCGKENHCITEYCDIPDSYCGSLADLAFRLRDEVDKVKFGKAMGLVYQKSAKPLTSHYHEFIGWLIALSQPIHWIVAALIAKQGEQNG